MEREDRLSEQTVTITWDGDQIQARPGEPVSVALWRAGHVTQTRSLKYHRPRGPMCMTGDCPGCLIRVGGIPNVRGCTTPVEEGMEVESQTGWPSAEHDVLGIVDRLFDRFDHERRFVRPQPVNRVYEAVARQLAGFGTQPTGEVPVAEGRGLTTDVLVAGGGPAGLAAANAVHEAGNDLLLVDERLEGGSLSYHHGEIDLPQFEASHGPALARGMVESLPEQAQIQGALVGLYEQEPAAVLADTSEGLAVHVVEAETTVLAVGGYEGPSIIDGNDIPGVLGARAARIMLGRWELAPGDPVAVLAPGQQGIAFERLAEDRGLETIRIDEPQWIEGERRVTAVVGDGRRHSVEAAVVDPGLRPAAELGRQAGVPYTWMDELGGRVPLHRADGSTPVADVYVAGSCAGLHTLEAGLIQGKAAGQRAANQPVEGVDKTILSRGQLPEEQREAIRSVWNE